MFPGVPITVCTVLPKHGFDLVCREGDPVITGLPKRGVNLVCRKGGFGTGLCRCQTRCKSLLELMVSSFRIRRRRGAHGALDLLELFQRDG